MKWQYRQYSFRGNSPLTSALNSSWHYNW